MDKYLTSFATVLKNNSTQDGKEQTSNDELLSPTAVAISLVFFAFVVFFSILCNCLVIVTFSRWPKLQTITNSFVVSLAVFDLLISMLSVPLWMVHIRGRFQTTREPDTLYRVWIFSDVVGGTGSILNLSMISYERYLCLSKPLSTHLTKSRARFLITFIWCVAILLAVLQQILTIYVGEPAREIFFSVACFFIPLLFMSYNYLQIFKLARSQLFKINHNVPRNMANFLTKELKAAKTIAIIIGVFVFCWTPFFVLNLLFGLCSCWWKLSKDLILAAKWLHYLNSFLNPIIYTWRNREFRGAFLKLLKSGFKKTARFDSSDAVIEFQHLKKYSVTTVKTISDNQM